jgi:peptide/nickel transport system permease protein
MSIPPILLAVALMALTRASVSNVIIAITVAEFPRVSRLVRGVVLSLREQPYVDAAVAAGTRTPMIILRHILPNTLAPLIVQATTSFPVAILAEAALAYLGLGTQPPHPSWGLMLKEAQNFLSMNPWFALFPGGAIATAVLGLNLLGDGLRDLLDPKTT